MEQCVDVRKIFKSYPAYINDDGENHVLNGFSLSLKIGEICVLTGASGCGKTTLLNCILGLQSVDSGSISILNRKVEFKKTSKFAKLVGFMPQKMSLVRQLSVVETVQYFANLQLIDAETFKQRFAALVNLLELPSPRRLIRDMSGGEQRRVSLAAAIIHQPQLLILDEPTVGLDFEIRSKIWSFLNNQTRASQLTVLITTHCFNEMMKADRCCYMWNGKAAFNDSPQRVLERFESETIGELFSKMTLLNCMDEDREKSENSLCDEEIVKEKAVRWQVIKGLLLKEFHRLKRQPLEAFLVLFLGIIGVFLANLSIGRFPAPMRLGVVNRGEFDHGKRAYLDHISILESVIFDTFEEAQADFEDGKILGIMSMAENFTTALANEGDIAVVTLDGSKFVFSSYIKLQIIEGFQKFMMNKSIDFDAVGFHSVKPLHVEGLFQDTKLLDGALVISIIGMLSHSVFIINECRNEGVWNRSLLSGAKMSEIMVANLILCFLHALLSAAQITATITWLQPIDSFSHIILVLSVTFYGTVTGFLIGLLASMFFNRLEASAGFGLLFITMGFFVTAFIWPLEGKSRWILPLSYAFPTTLPDIFMKRMITRGLCSWTLALAAGTSVIVWKTFLLVSLHAISNRRKFSQM